MEAKVEFANSEVKLLGEFLQALTANGLKFSLSRDAVGYRVTLTGGY